MVNVPSTDNRARLVAPRSYIPDSLRPTNGLIFPYTPMISYSQSVSYSGYDMVHTNYTTHAYSNTPSPSISVSGQFTTTTQAEHEYTLAAIQFFRNVTKMRYGESSAPGTPPPVCRFSGMGDKIFNNVPVLIADFGTTFENSVDLITHAGQSLPAMLTLTVTLMVHINPAKQKQFDIDKFASGELYSKGFI
jgi:hypothetical protein